MGIFSAFRKISIEEKITDETYESLEEQLVLSDVGVDTSIKLVNKVHFHHSEVKTNTQLRNALCQEVLSIIDIPKPEMSDKPQVILVIGVNGVGKTTTIGKLAKKLSQDKKTVTLAAADTFRAAAVEQLKIWADRTGAKLISHSEGADPAAVVHDAIESGIANKTDYIICDTAGRLQNKKNLMDELSKIRRVIDRLLPNSKPLVLLVLDATTGQNGLSQAKEFKDAAGVNGIVLTKLDGTAKGGIIVAIAKEVSLPVLFVGVGEGVDDIYEFDAKDYAESLTGVKND